MVVFIERDLGDESEFNETLANGTLSDPGASNYLPFAIKEARFWQELKEEEAAAFPLRPAKAHRTS